MRAAPAPLVHSELENALDVLEAMHRGARANLKASGRDPGAAAVLLRDWAAAMHARRSRFGPVLAELERRGLVHVDGPFARIWP